MSCENQFILNRERAQERSRDGFDGGAWNGGHGYAIGKTNYPGSNYTACVRKWNEMFMLDVYLRGHFLETRGLSGSFVTQGQFPCAMSTTVG